MKHFGKRSLCAIVILFLAMLSVTTVRAEFQKTKIAVLDFEMIGDKMETASIGAIISEWFITGIVKSGRFDVVERAMLQKILAEQKLGASGVIDEQSAAALGKVLGVKAIISGSLLKLEDAIDINARVISVESGSIIAAENIRSSAKSDLHALVDELIARILLNFPLTGYVVKKGEKTAIIDLGLDSGLTVSTEFIVYREGEVIKHPKTGEVLDVEQIHTGRLRITKVSKNVAEGSIVSEENNGGILYGQMVKSVKREAASTKAKEKGEPRGTAAPPTVEKPAVVEKPESKPEEMPAAKTADPPPPKPAPPAKTVKVKAEKKKVEPEPQVAAAPPPPPVAPPPKPEVKPAGDAKVAIFPWVMVDDGGRFTGFLVDRLQYYLADAPGLELAASFYQLKNVASFSAGRAATFFNGSTPNLEELRRTSKELGADVAVVGKLDVHCRYSDECTLESIEVFVVDLASGAVTKETGTSGVDAYANDGIDRTAAKAIRDFAATRRAAGAATTPASVGGARADGDSSSYRVALFPWLMNGSADSFAGILADRINYHLGDVDKAKLTHAAYSLKGVTPLKGLKAASYVGHSGPKIEELREKGRELGVNAAIVGQLNVRCRFADQCSVESLNAYFIDLADGRVVEQSAGGGGESYAQDAIDGAIGKLCRQIVARK